VRLDIVVLNELEEIAGRIGDQDETHARAHFHDAIAA
jgi:hypothetical protein